MYFTNCLSRVDTMQVDDAHNINVVLSICNLVEYSDNYLKKSEILRQNCRDKPALANDNIIADSL